MKNATTLDICYGKKQNGWKVTEVRADGVAWINPKRRLYVIASTHEYGGNQWLHLSMSHQKRIPNYDEMKYLKRHWAGDQAKAIEVHAPDSEHVNICARARHLWVCLDGDPLPDFTLGVGSI